MVVCQLNVRRSFVRPDKANPVLIVHPDRMLTFAVAHQRFQAISGWGTQVRKDRRGIDHFQFAPDDPENVGWKAFTGLSVKGGCRDFILEAPDHAANVSSFDTFASECIT
jgi:hypothetical protein